MTSVSSVVSPAHPGLSVTKKGIQTYSLFSKIVTENIAAHEAGASTPGGGDFYKRKKLYIEPETDPHTNTVLVHGRVEEMGEDSYILVHDPNHPGADQDGNVRYPDIDLMTERVDLMNSQHALSANVHAFKTTLRMYQDVLSIME